MDFFGHSLAKMTSWRFAQYPSNGLTVPRQSDPYQPRSVTDLAADEVRRSLHPLGEAERHEVCSVPGSVFRISCILTGTIGTLLRFTHTLSISIFSNSRLPSITHSYGVSTSNEASSQSLIAFSRNSPSLELIGNRPQCRLEARGLVGSTNPQCLDVIASFDDDLHIQYMGYAALDTLDPKRHSRQLKLN